MQIEKTNSNELTLDECRNIEGWDRTFEYDGYTYVVISNDGESRHTRIEYPRGMVPCLNLKSHTVRALRSGEVVKPLKSKVQTRKIL